MREALRHQEEDLFGGALSERSTPRGTPRGTPRRTEGTPRGGATKRPSMMRNYEIENARAAESARISAMPAVEEEAASQRAHAQLPRAKEPRPLQDEKGQRVPTVARPSMMPPPPNLSHWAVAREAMLPQKAPKSKAWRRWVEVVNELSRNEAALRREVERLEQAKKELQRAEQAVRRVSQAAVARCAG